MQDKKKQNKTAQKTLFDIMKNDLLLDKMDEWSKVSWNDFQNQGLEFRTEVLKNLPSKSYIANAADTIVWKVMLIKSRSVNEFLEMTLIK